MRKINFKTPEDLNDLKITKYNKYKIYFYYKGISYFLKEITEDYETSCTLFKRNFQDGKIISLEVVHSEYISRGIDIFIRSKIKKNKYQNNIPLSQIDKEYFVVQLTLKNYIDSYFNKIININKQQILKLTDEKIILQNKINEIQKEEKRLKSPEYILKYKNIERS